MGDISGIPGVQTIANLSLFPMRSNSEHAFACAYMELEYDFNAFHNLCGLWLPKQPKLSNPLCAPCMSLVLQALAEAETAGHV